MSDSSYIPPPMQTEIVRLVWSEEGRGVATVREVPLDAVGSEATDALFALGALECSQCQRPLRAASAYACCYQPHCPYCGEQTLGMWNRCPHQVLSFAFEEWSVREFAADERPLPLLDPALRPLYDQWGAMQRPTPPSRRLPKQKGNGYPRWAAEQLDQAYPPDVRPCIEVLFGPDLRTFSKFRLGPVLFPVLRPDIKISITGGHGFWLTFYFHADPAQAIGRGVRFFTRLEAGRERLRALPPQTFVPRQKGVDTASGRDTDGE